MDRQNRVQNYKKNPTYASFVGFFGLEGMILLFYHLDYFRGNAADDGIGGHIFGDDRSGGNDGIVTDGDALQDGNVRTKPYFFADMNGFGGHARPLRRVGDVIERAECGVMTDKSIVVDEDTALVLELTAHIDKHPFADMRVLAAIGIERRKHTERLRHVYRP